MSYDYGLWDSALEIPFRKLFNVLCLGLVIYVIIKLLFSHSLNCKIVRQVFAIPKSFSNITLRNKIIQN